jgi:hypothetical protein
MRAPVVAMSRLIFVRARLRFTLRHEGLCRKWMRFNPSLAAELSFFARQKLCIRSCDLSTTQF